MKSSPSVWNHLANPYFALLTNTTKWSSIFFMLLRVSKESDIQEDKETQQHFTKPEDSWTDVTAASSRSNQGVKEKNIPREET